MRQPLVAGNWKMNGSRDFTRGLINEVMAGLSGVAGDAGVIVCPPFTYLDAAAQQLAGQSGVALGAQNLDFHDSGAFTGEISAGMLVDTGCEYVIVGHSERRAYYGETNEIVSRKAAAALESGLKPIVCVGETLEQREAGDTDSVVADQIGAVVDSLGVGAFSDIIVAYEPVWAIGTGKTATPEQAQAVHALIRSRLGAHDETVASGVRILYGGSVKPDNARELFAKADIDGGLIGGASLKAKDFLNICNATG